MQLPQIRTESRLGQISLNTIDAKQEIRQPQADLTIEQPHAEMSIETKPAKLMIDQTQAFEDMNLMNILKRIQKNAQEGMQAASEGTGRRAAEGTDLMRIENGGNPIAQQADSRAHTLQKALGIKFIPSPFSVKINFEPAKVDIRIEPQKVKIEAKVNAPQVDYVPGRVDIELSQRPELNIDFVNLYT